MEAVSSVRDLESTRVLLNVDHVRQHQNWDCGLACVAMVIQNLESRANYLANQTNILTEEELDESVWTIDLAYILKRLDIDSSYYTVTIGVNQDYKNEPYYSNIVDVDNSRVTRKFNEAHLKGVHVLNRTITLNEILNEITTHPAIVLLDANLIRCHEIGHNHMLADKLVDRFCYCCCCFKKSSYHGHYVVLIGYDPLRKVIFYNDPSRNEERCQMTYDCFERSRKARGTDQDIIIVKGFTTS